MKTGFQGFIYCYKIHRQQSCGSLYVKWDRWLNDASARLDFSRPSFDSSGAVHIILVPDKIRVNIRITFFTKKQEPALGWTLQVGFEDGSGNDHWGNRAT
jgi:hypothetical protein